MTTFDDPREDLQQSSYRALEGEDRRQPARRERLSWASDRPFKPPVEDGNEVDPVDLAEDRRGRWARPLIARLLVGDVASALLVTSVTVYLSPGHKRFIVPALLVAALGWPLMLLANRAYDSLLVGQGPDEFQAVLRSMLLMAAGLALVAYLANENLPRRYVLLVTPVVAALTAVYRYIIRQELHTRRAHGDDVLRTLVVGNPSAVDGVVRDLAAAPHHGYWVVGACVPGELADVELAEGTRAVGTLSDVPQAVVDHEVDVVIVAGSDLAGSSLRRLSWALERTGAELVVAPGLVEVTGPRLQMRPTAGLSLLHVESASSRVSRLVGKWVLDRTLGTVLFLLSLPIVALAAAAVALTSRGGAFYRQTRVGRDGEHFTMWKIRTMVANADQLRVEILPDSDRDGLMFKMHRDPRVTRVGSVLRRFSLDELPQLWNVMTGTMSLVGPRPPLPEEYRQYHDQVHRRLRVKPGVTGLWQVSGRADLPWDESIRLDLRYVDNWSLALDLQILWKTLRAVLLGSGAY
jgi:exopolysaccharide biosynthesis polyprenyl glycosylphosphotransferase